MTRIYTLISLLLVILLLFTACSEVAVSPTDTQEEFASNQQSVVAETEAEAEPESSIGTEVQTTEPVDKNDSVQSGKDTTVTVDKTQENLTEAGSSDTAAMKAPPGETLGDLVELEAFFRGERPNDERYPEFAANIDTYTYIKDGYYYRPVARGGNEDITLTGADPFITNIWYYYDFADKSFQNGSEKARIILICDTVGSDEKKRYLADNLEAIEAGKTAEERGFDRYLITTVKGVKFHVFERPEWTLIYWEQDGVYFSGTLYNVHFEKIQELLPSFIMERVSYKK